jgi:hypothetical protein
LTRIIQRAAGIKYYCKKKNQNELGMNKKKKLEEKKTAKQAKKEKLSARDK